MDSTVVVVGALPEPPPVIPALCGDPIHKAANRAVVSKPEVAARICAFVSAPREPI